MFGGFQIDAFQIDAFQQPAGAAVGAIVGFPFALDEDMIPKKKKRRTDDRAKLLAEEDELIMRAIVEFLNHANK